MHEIVPMASTTKILTALVAITHGDLDREVTISKNAASIRGSKVGYVAGEKIRLRELLYGLMYKSGNDAAIAIAEDIGGSVEGFMYKSGNDAAIAIAEDIGGSVEGFAKIMNDYAISLGLINSHFESPHGLDSAKHYTCAYDLALLTTKAMESELFCQICGTKSITMDTSNFTRDYNNINKILYKIPEANGVKTGYTGQAGKCLVSSVKHEGRNIIIVVLNCSDRWNVTENIYKYVVDNYSFKNENVKDIAKTSEFISLGSVIEECDFEYGFKGEGSIEVEVLFCQICGTKSITMDTSNFTRDYNNINKILYKIPEANGVKTGYTGQAGKCLVSSVKHEGRNIIIVVLNCSDRWNVTENIYKYVVDNYSFKNENVKDIAKTSEFISLGSVIEECDFEYGFKGEGSIEVEVFNTINKNSGDIIGKVALNNQGEELVKKALICGKDITENEFEEIVNTGSTNY